MNQSLPIRFQELLQLTSVGIKPTSIKFSTVGMEGERYITVVEKVSEQSEVVIVDLNDSTNTVRHVILGEQAIMNPAGTVIAVLTKASNATSTIEIFDAEMKCRFKTHTMRCDVVYWKWVTVSTLALVTLNSIFHWTLEGDTSPTKIFDRISAMTSFQVIDYKVNLVLEWFVLVGLSAERDKVVGKLQLYSKERQCSQLIDGHAACFARFKFPGNVAESNLLCFTSTLGQTQNKLHFVEVGQPHPENRPIVKRSVDLLFSTEAPNDFPVAMQSGYKHGVLYLITKYGYLYMYDIETTTCMYINRISADTIFVTTPYESAGGVIGVNRKGQVLSVAVDELNVIPYLKNVLQNPDLALFFAARNGLAGAEEQFLNKFNNSFDNKEYKEAAKYAVVAPGGILRTPEILQKFQQAKIVPGQTSPLLQYFGTLLDHGQLNKHESLEICRPVLLQGKKELLEKWLTQNKLECSEELGNLVNTVDSNLALSVYLRASAPNKVVECFSESGQFEKILHYSNKVNYSPDYIYLLRNVISANPDKGLEFAKILLRDGKPLVEIRQIVDAFTERSLVQQCTAFLLEALKYNHPYEGDLQTKLLEMNLLFAPQVADAILGNQMFTYYDKYHIGQLCEKAGLLKRALEHYTDLDDIKRVIVHTECLESDWLVSYFGTLCVDDSIQCLKAILSIKSKQNLNICLQVAGRYHKQLTVAALIELFESLDSPEGLFCFLGSIIQDCQDEEVHFKYIKAATELGQIGVVESICRTSNSFCPEKVKNYLKEAKIKDYLPLVIVCDRFNFINDLILFLNKNKLTKYIEMYVKNVNSSRLPTVVGELLDLDSPEEFVKHLITEVRGSFSIEELVTEVENRNRLNILLSWLEERLLVGCTDVATHNALAKIYIDSNLSPEKFLKENKFYDSCIVGKYCETRNPLLASIAYEKGECDIELINLYKENSLFRQAAKCLVRRKNPELWATVLNNDDYFRKNVVDEVIHSNLLIDIQDPTEVSETVKAFLAAELTKEIVQVLDKLLGENNIFSEEPNLQNLLILTAMKVDKQRVMEFIGRFKDYAAEEIANIAVNNGLYDEALAIYKKFNMNDSAMNILMKYLDNVEEGQEFAELCEEATVWNSLGQAQLHRGLIKDAIASFLKAQNPSSCEEVVKTAQEAGEWEDLVRFLQMATKKYRDTFTESELIYAYAKTGQLKELEEFISNTNNADINMIGDRCYEYKLYEAAKLLYNNSSNFSSLAVTLISLKEFQGAVECARKANKIQTWKAVCFSCLEEREFRFAQMCALHIIVNAEELDSLINYYEEREFYDELISLMEIGLSHERAHMGMFTQLGILYSKYKPEKLRDHLEMFWSRMNIPKVVRAAEEAHMWQELVFLHDKYEHYDSALTVMMEHPTEAWKEGYFNEITLKVSNHQLHLKAVQFYLEFKPLLLNNFLTSISGKLDNPKAVGYLAEAERLQLVKPYLKSVQHINDRIINEALNGLLIAEEDFRGLRTSIDSFDNFDTERMAQRLVKNELMEFKRIAALLYRRNNSWKESVDLCKENGLFTDAIETAAASMCHDISEDLLEWFLVEGKKDCFAACLFQCYELFRPDVVLELAWRHSSLDLAMPYMIQVIRDYVQKVDSIDQDRSGQGQEEPQYQKSLTYHSEGSALQQYRK